MLSDPSILVCTDFSESSDHALVTAEKIRKKTHGTILMLHVAEVGFYLEWGAYGIKPRSVHEEFIFELHKDLRKRMHDQLQRCKLEAQSHIIIGSSAQHGILATIEDKKIDLVVMGDKGAKNGDLFYTGGLTKKMAASCPVPLMVIRDEFSMDKMAGLVDSAECKSGVIETAQEYSLLLSSDLTIISLLQDHTEGELLKIREKLKNYLVPDTSTHIMVEMSKERKVAHQLAEILHEGGFELAVMKRHQKSAAEKFFLGSETGRLLEIFKGNLLICPPTKEVI